MISDRLVLYSLSTRRDWLCSSSRLRFYHLACLRFSAELFLFVIFSTFFFVFVQLFFIYRLSSRSLRNHLTLLLFIDDHDAMIVKWSSTRKKRLLKRETSIKLCCVACASLNRKRVKVEKILRAVIEFRSKKRELDVVLSDSKFDQFVLMFMICFVDFSQSEMMLLSSKKMKNDYEMMKFESSNWFDDDVEIDKANWLKDSVANFDDDDLSNWQNIRVETIQKIVLSNWLKNCVEIDEKIRKWVAMNQCDDDEKENEKEKDYKNASEIFLSTTIIAVIIIIIIIEKNVDFCEDFDCLSICSVEFFDSLSSLREKDWEEISKFDFEKNLKEEFVCVACSFAEFSVFENAHFDCEFCDSFLILFLLSMSESIAFLIFSSTLENLANENQSFESFLSMRKKEVENEKKVVFTSCSSVCVFVNSSIESLFAFIFSVSELSFSISFVSSSAFLNSEKCEFVQERKKTFFSEKLVIESSVANSCETSSSSSLSLDKSCVEIIKIEEKKKKKSNFFFFEFFVIDVLFYYRQRCQEENSRKKRKKKCFLKSSINIERVDQFSTKAMQNWLKKLLRKENYRNRHFAKKEQRSSRRRSNNSDSRRRFHLYKFCRCCLVDWSLCSHQRLSKRFSSTIITLRSFLIDTRICVWIMISKRKKKFVVCLDIAIL